MKKVVMRIGFVCLFLCLTACGNLLNDGEVSSSIIESTEIEVKASNQFSETFQGFIILQSDYAKMGIETVEMYIDIPEDTSQSLALGEM